MSFCCPNHCSKIVALLEKRFQGGTASAEEILQFFTSSGDTKLPADVKGNFTQVLNDAEDEDTGALSIHGLAMQKALSILFPTTCAAPGLNLHMNPPTLPEDFATEGEMRDILHRWGDEVEQETDVPLLIELWLSVKEHFRLRTFAYFFLLAAALHPAYKVFTT